MSDSAILVIFGRLSGVGFGVGVSVGVGVGVGAGVGVGLGDGEGLGEGLSEGLGLGFSGPCEAWGFGAGGIWVWAPLTCWGGCEGAEAKVEKAPGVGEGN